MLETLPQNAGKRCRRRAQCAMQLVGRRCQERKDRARLMVLAARRWGLLPDAERNVPASASAIREQLAARQRRRALRAHARPIVFSFPHRRDDSSAHFRSGRVVRQRRRAFFKHKPVFSAEVLRAEAPCSFHVVQQSRANSNPPRSRRI